MNDSSFNKWEKRWHPLRQEWVIYAAHRNSRPWSFEPISASKKAPDYDPTCYLCPTNKRVSGQQNPDYEDVYIFDNDHPVVGLDAPAIAPQRQSAHEGLYQRQAATGIARVICYDPRHNVTLSEISLERVIKVFEAWQQQTLEMEAHSAIKSLLIFENKGEVVGVSSPHPHCQLYAVDFDFTVIAQELAVLAQYQSEKGRNLFADIIAAEQKDELRVVAENQYAIAFLPFFARYAYEIYLFPKKRHATLSTVSAEELSGMAAVFQEVIRRYDLNFQMSFPYVMVVKQAPVDGEPYPDYHLHLHFLPPLRQPNLLKFLGGPETGVGNFMADTLPEEKAAELRRLSVAVG